MSQESEQERARERESERKKESERVGERERERSERPAVAQPLAAQHTCAQIPGSRYNAPRAQMPIAPPPRSCTTRARESARLAMMDKLTEFSTHEPRTNNAGGRTARAGERGAASSGRRRLSRSSLLLTSSN